MTIEFTCPHCGTQTDVYDQYAGSTGPCAICGRLVTVPLAAPVRHASPAIGAVVVAGGWTRRRARSVLLAGVVSVTVLAGVAVTIWILSALVFPVISAGRQNALRARSAANMKSIVAAMQSYEADFNSLPPAFLADDDGRPMHSWRVLLLPYLGYDHVYRRYDFAQPWDSPQNSQLLAMMPSEYASPADPDAKSRYETSYMVVVGPRTAFPGIAATSRSQFADGLDATMVLAETPVCGISWLQPVDLRADLMRFTINGREGVEIGSRCVGGAHVGLADGTVEFLTDDTPPEYVQALTTIAGNEAVPWFAAQ